jgi:Tfp pilus assembly protein PilN
MRDEMADDETLQPQPAADAATPGSSRATRVFVVILWLFAVGGLVSLAPLALLARNLGQQVDALHADLASAQRRIEAASTPGPTAQALLAELTQLEAAAEALGAAQAEVVAGSYDYPAVMAAIAGYPRESVRLDALSQGEDQITVEGRADSEAAVADYAQSLEASGLFEQVLLRALEAIPEEEREPPPPEVAPGEATLTPTLSITVTYPLTPALGTLTPGAGDAVAPDHSEPVAINLGEPYTRTFDPLYVLHRATFEAQAGAVYRVRTLNLASGVDTFLVVMVGDATYVNHNRAPGELASEMVFQAHPTTSLPATVTVTNRGEYGPDKTYQLLVEQVPLTATPTPTVTNTPSPTATPTPTIETTPTLTPLPPTPSLTPTPSATPPMPDPYESDDMVPVPISVGETQERTFYPQNDVDRVVFLAKTGRRYRVYTSDLALEVDTQLFVHVGDDTYINDDVAAGEHRSEIVFDVTLGHDVLVRVNVHNRGLYGPTNNYKLTVEEVVAAPAPTITGTPPFALDPYEPDDAAPVVIAVGETQERFFYPEGDVDKVTFLAKAGRSYRVYTSDLAPGVDTFIVVSVAGRVYTNDDRGPGDLGSLVEFTVDVSYDDQAVVEIRNRGQYGPDKAYKITVEEILPPDAPAVYEPDGYEPDDVVPAVMGVGETQQRTFYPEEDIDQVSFLAKSGRWYAVSTANLAPGVDTMLTVWVDGAVHVNDDRPGAGPGEYDSLVEFQVPPGADVQVVALVINKQGIYRPDASYEITVLETATSWEGGSRGPGLAAWRDGPTGGQARGAAPQQVGPAAQGPVRFTLVLRPTLREAP